MVVVWCCGGVGSRKKERKNPPGPTQNVYVMRLAGLRIGHLISGIMCAPSEHLTVLGSRRLSGAYAGFSEGGCREGGGVPRSAKEANNPILLKVQSLQLSFRPAGVSLGGGGGQGPPWPPPPLRTPLALSGQPTARRLSRPLISVPDRVVVCMLKAQ